MISSWLVSLWGPASKPPQTPAASAPLQPPPPPPPPPAPAPQIPNRDLAEPPPPIPDHSPFTRRSARQLTLFFAGAAFLGLTTAVTRRSVARKIRDAVPKFFTPSSYLVADAPKTQSAEGTLFALEALSLATLNTFSFGIMATGGLAWAFDISTLDDLKARARRHQQGKGLERDEEAEDTLEAWIASTMGMAGDKKEEREAKEWMAKLLVQAKEKQEAEKKSRE